MNTNTRIDQIVLPELESSEIELFIKRDDLIDEHVSGNKLFKLKYNIEQAKEENKSTVLTFGGAFSNHIAATAQYCADQHLKSIGIIRGERTEPLNPTLSFAQGCGMQLAFISREDYRKKDDTDFLNELSKRFDRPFIIPEGGNNELGIEGAAEIINERSQGFDYIVTAMGTGTTFAGMVYGKAEAQIVVGLPIHKHEKLLEDILQIVPDFADIESSSYQIINGYHFGGYAKWTPELVDFIQEFYQQTNIKLDPVYTGKAMFGLIDLIKKDRFAKGSKILFVHTGGLQGVAGFEKRFGLKLF